MEAVVAVGLASNVLNFIEFAANLVQIENELKHKPLVAEYRNYEHIARDLQNHADQIKATKATSINDKNLIQVADSCCSLAKQLCRRVKSCTTRSGHNNVIGRTLTAVSTLWNKREIFEIMHTLGQLRSEIILHTVRNIEKRQAEDAALYATKNDIQVLGRRVTRVLADVNTMRRDIDLQMESNRLSLIHAVEKLIPADMSLCRRAKVEFTHDISAVHGPIHDGCLQAPRAIGASRRYGQFSIIDLHELREDKCFYLPVEKPPHDELQILADGGKDCCKITNEMSAAKIHKPYGSVAIRKHGTTVYLQQWSMKTRVCALVLTSRNKTVRNEHNPNRTTTSYEVELHFTAPSALPTWLSTSFSLRCSLIFDRVRCPALTLQPAMYRVLEEHHVVWNLIEYGDVDAIRLMLMDKKVFPSDRDSRGSTLLHNAAFFNQVEVCKCLIQHGADVNATNYSGLTSIVDASISWKIMEEDDGLAAFHYLRSLSSINLEAFWENEQYAFISAQSFDCFFHVDAVLQDLEPEVVVTRLRRWLVCCQSIDADLDIPCSWTLLELVVAYLSESALPEMRCSWWTPFPAYQNFLVTREEDGPDHFFTLERRILVFDFIVDLVSSEKIRGRLNSDVPMQLAVRNFVALLCEARDAEERLRIRAASDSQAWYRGFNVSFPLATNLRFLEHVIVTSIKRRPDCIFDVVSNPRNNEHNDCITDLFRDQGLQHIWDDILQERGLDSTWVAEQFEQRRRVSVGESSAHEILVLADTRRLLQHTKRRRSYNDPSD